MKYQNQIYQINCHLINSFLENYGSSNHSYMFAMFLLDFLSFITLIYQYICINIYCFQSKYSISCRQSLNAIKCQKPKTYKGPTNPQNTT